MCIHPTCKHFYGNHVKIYTICNEMNKCRYTKKRLARYLCFYVLLKILTTFHNLCEVKYNLSWTTGPSQSLITKISYSVLPEIPGFN